MSTISDEKVLAAEETRLVEAMIVLHPAIARAARAYTLLTHKQLGSIAKVSARTVFKLEKDGKITDESLRRILAAFSAQGVEMKSNERGLVTGLEFTRPLPEHPR